MATVAVLLQEGMAQLRESSDSARADVEILLCQLLGKPRSFLFTWPEHEVPASQVQQFFDWLAQRRDGTPVASLTGRREFYGHEFRASPAPPTPRADTHTPVGAALARLPDARPGRTADRCPGTRASPLRRAP